ncbi:DUF2125 domain-containing protein [Rhizobium sp. AG855]|uniref:DUF2125 domain-containing protein n=1 Tax=Rhizobium sp. AG855 TaxID=2183898 RepID=UPI000E721239|nr:DUF2125 domain-containing protein [Rhizobium sp. AG855]RKE80222.1 hypothetical protein DFO46_3816 [Rhizobium sp. AG855]
MAVPSTAPQSPTSRKVLLLGLLIVLFIAVYSVAWHFAAEFLRNRITGFFSGGNPAGVSANCENATMGGYPSRFRLNCDRLSFDDNFQGISASSGPVRAAAQVYNPGQVVWEMDGPAEIRSALGFNSTLEWSDLRASFRAGFSGLQRSSMEWTDLKTKVTSTVTGLQIEVTTPHLESHVRQNEGNLDYAALINDTVVAVNGTAIALPPVSASIDATFADRGGLLDPRLAHRQELYGTKGELRRMVVDAGEGRVLTLRGPFSVGNDGLISGSIRVEIEKIRAWRDTLKTAYPDQQETFDDLAKVLRVLTLGKDDGSAEITIQNGVASLGFIPLGQLPPL